MKESAEQYPASPAQRAIAMAQVTLDIEAAAVLGLKNRIGLEFARAVAMILSIKGRVVLMGMGKSGHIGRKIAATLASTGTPAMFVHPAEASHGDLGMITQADLVLAISKGWSVKKRCPGNGSSSAHKLVSGFFNLRQDI